MFKLDPNPTFWATVTVRVPGGTGQFDLQFKYLRLAERERYAKDLEGKSNLDALAELIADWRGIDADYNRDNLEQLLNEYPDAVRAITACYWGEVTGAIAKN
jgi:hypothetical protein